MRADAAPPLMLPVVVALYSGLGGDCSSRSQSETGGTPFLSKTGTALVFFCVVWEDSCTFIMRKSSEVPLTLLAAAAMMTLGCHDQPRHCVDAQNHLMPDSTCEAHSGSGGYHYVWGGSSGGHYGDSVVGSSVSRGGFGHGGGGEGGGE